MAQPSGGSRGVGSRCYPAHNGGILLLLSSVATAMYGDSLVQLLSVWLGIKTVIGSCWGRACGPSAPLQGSDVSTCKQHDDAMRLQGL